MIGNDMSSRERIRAALAHKEADRVPVDFGSRSSAIEQEAYDDLKRHLGLLKPTKTFLRAHAELDEEIYETLHIDTRYVRSIPPESWQDQGADRIYVDRWQVPWRKRADSPYYELDLCPLQELDPSDILRAFWPELISDRMLSDMTDQAERWRREHEQALFCDVVGAGVFERAWYLRGFEQFMTDLVLDPVFAEGFLEKILEHQLSGYQRILEAIGSYIDGVWITDDLATQDSLIVSPDLYRRLIKPYQRRLVEFIQQRNVAVVFHSCGAVTPLIPDLIDIGVQILHPVQLSARGMDAAQLKAEYGADLVFWGGGCDSETLQQGRPQDVQDEVRNRIEILAPGGGFVFTSTHCIQPGTPPENILTMVDTLLEYGSY